MNIFGLTGIYFKHFCHEIWFEFIRTLMPFKQMNIFGRNFFQTCLLNKGFTTLMNRDEKSKATIFCFPEVCRIRPVMIS